MHREPEQRRACYRALVSQGISEEELANIRIHAQRQRALGTDQFQKAIEAQLGRSAGIGIPGRPRKSRTET